MWTLVEGVPVHGRGLEVDDPLGSLPTQTVLWLFMEIIMNVSRKTANKIILFWLPENIEVKILFSSKIFSFMLGKK